MSWIFTSIGYPFLFRSALNVHMVILRTVLIIDEITRSCILTIAGQSSFLRRKLFSWVCTIDTLWAHPAGHLCTLISMDNAKLMHSNFYDGIVRMRISTSIGQTTRRSKHHILMPLSISANTLKHRTQAPLFSRYSRTQHHKPVLDCTVALPLP